MKTMKYRVTEKHPAYKEDLKIENDTLFGDDKTGWESVTHDECNEWVGNGWIEEIQEQEFTRNDMVKFGEWCDTGDYKNDESVYEKALNDWLK